MKSRDATARTGRDAPTATSTGVTTQSAMAPQMTTLDRDSAACSAGFATAATGLCLDVVGGGTTDGTGIDIWTDNGATNQRWTPTLVSGTNVLAVEIHQDRVVWADLFQAEVRGLHPEALGARLAHRHVAPDQVAVALHRQDATARRQRAAERQVVAREGTRLTHRHSPIARRPRPAGCQAAPLHGGGGQSSAPW